MLLKYAENRQKQKTEKFIIQIIMVSLAGIACGIAFKSFFEPAGIIPTGLSGFSIIIHNLLTKIGVSLPTSVVYLIINVLMFLFAFRIFGWKFLLLSGLGAGFYTLTMQFGSIPPIAQASQINILLYAIVGSMITGLSIGVAMKYGGTTGGSEILASIINRYFPKIKTGYCLLLIDVIVLVLSFVTAGLQTGLYALIVAVIDSLATNLVLDGSKRIVAHYIICDEPNKIAEALLERYHRGVTKIEGEGVFSRKHKSILLCLLPNEQSSEMKKIVSSIDANSFVFSSAVTETMGDGSFMKEVSIFSHKVKAASPLLKASTKYNRHLDIKSLKLKRKQKRFKIYTQS